MKKKINRENRFLANSSYTMLNIIFSKLYIRIKIYVSLFLLSQNNLTTAYFWRRREITNRRRHVAALAVVKEYCRMKTENIVNTLEKCSSGAIYLRCKRAWSLASRPRLEAFQKRLILWTVTCRRVKSVPCMSKCHYLKSATCQVWCTTGHR